MLATEAPTEALQQQQLLRLAGGSAPRSLAEPPMSGGPSMDCNELNAAEYSTDEFRMFSFKVVRCSKRYVHDWRTCPFSHPTENARRRDPREYKYLPFPCPEYKKGICILGDACPFAHGVYECWLHPCKYRTQLCKDGEACRRPVCFFAHSSNDMRQAVTDYNPTREEMERLDQLRAQKLAELGAGSKPASTSPLDGAAPFPSVLDPALAAAGLTTGPGSLPPSAPSSSRPSLDFGLEGPAGRLSLDGPLAHNPSSMLPSSAALAAAQAFASVSASSPPRSAGFSSPTSSHSSADALDSAPVALAASAPAASGPVVAPLGTFEAQGTVSGPRMSNAIARKLGLAPVREPRRSHGSRRSASLDYPSTALQVVAATAAANAAAVLQQQQLQKRAAMAAAAARLAAPNAAADPVQLNRLAQLVAAMPQDVYPQYAMPDGADNLCSLLNQLQALSLAQGNPKPAMGTDCIKSPFGTSSEHQALPSDPLPMPAHAGLYGAHPLVTAGMPGLDASSLTGMHSMGLPGMPMAGFGDSSMAPVSHPGALGHNPVSHMGASAMSLGGASNLSSASSYGMAPAAFDEGAVTSAHLGAMPAAAPYGLPDDLSAPMFAAPERVPQGYY